jgi:hypothetical protein
VIELADRKMCDYCPLFTRDQGVSTAEINKLDGVDTATGAKFAQVQQAAVAYNDNGKVLMTIPNGAKILGMWIEVTTGFNASGATYKVGHATDDDAYASVSSGLGSAGRVVVSPPASTIAQWNGVSDGTLIGTAGGTGGSAGAGILKVAYYV